MICIYCGNTVTNERWPGYRQDLGTRAEIIAEIRAEHKEDCEWVKMESWRTIDGGPGH